MASCLQILRGVDTKYVYEYTRVNTKVDKPTDIFSASMDDPGFRHNLAIDNATNFKVEYHREKR